MICQRVVYWLVSASSAPVASASRSEIGRSKREQPETGMLAPSSVTDAGCLPRSRARWWMVEASV